MWTITTYRKSGRLFILRVIGFYVPIRPSIPLGRVCCRFRHPMLHRKQSDQDEGLDPRTTVWIALLTVLAGCLRFLHLSSKSFTPDEAFSIMLVRTGWQAFRHSLVTSEANMALYYLLLRMWSHTNDMPGLVRVLSVLPGIATVPAIYFVGKTFFSRSAELSRPCSFQ